MRKVIIVLKPFNIFENYPSILLIHYLIITIWVGYLKPPSFSPFTGCKHIIKIFQRYYLLMTPQILLLNNRVLRLLDFKLNSQTVSTKRDLRDSPLGGRRRDDRRQPTTVGNRK